MFNNLFCVNNFCLYMLSIIVERKSISAGHTSKKKSEIGASLVLTVKDHIGNTIRKTQELMH